MEIVDTYSHISATRAQDCSLGWVNQQRSKRGLRPLASLRPGERYSMRNNPIARALEVANVGIASVQYDEETDICVLPAPVIRFLQLFHDGYLPDLEAI